MLDTDRQAAATVNKVRLTGVPNPKFTASGTVDRFEFGTDRELKSVIFHIVNLRSYVGRPVRDLDGTMSVSRAITEADGWLITIDSLHDDAMYSDLKTSGVSRSPTSESLSGWAANCSQWKNRSQMFESLFRYLSFCRGCWVVPILTVGFDLNESRVWELWRDWKSSGGRSPYMV